MGDDEERGDHVIVMAALAAIRCRCGWHHQIEMLKGKTDEDLVNECLEEFQKHREKKGRKK